MSKYDKLDPILEEWAAIRGIKIQKGIGPLQRRIFHRSGGMPIYTFQVVFQPEECGLFRMDVHSIESPDGVSIHKIWETDEVGIPRALEEIDKFMKGFFVR